MKPCPTITEEWRDIEGYEGFYQVSDQGRVRSVDRFVKDGKGGQTRRASKILTPHAGGGKPYLKVVLSKESKHKSCTVHGLVANAFLGKRPPRMEILHGPKGQLDNSVCNLRYGTPSENQIDRLRDGQHLGKPVRRSDGVVFNTAMEAERATGVASQSISAVCRKRRQTAGGYSWEFI